MRISPVGRILWRLGEDKAFLERFLADFGIALTEEGFILTDEEMRELREHWEAMQGREPRQAQEKALAIARSRYRR